jgi:hypothetical protein
MCRNRGLAGAVDVPTARGVMLKRLVSTYSNGSSNSIDIDDDTDVEVRLFVVDLKAFLAQEYQIDSGKMDKPFGPPTPCLDAALEAAAVIFN